MKYWLRKKKVEVINQQPKDPEPQVSGGGTNDSNQEQRETKVPSWLQNRFR